MVNYERAVIIGVGLLGGSLGFGLRQRGLAQTVVGVGRRPEAIEHAVAIGAIDEAAEDLRLACQGADLVVVCTPVQMVVEHVRRAAKYLADHALITDVGSTKASIVEALVDLPIFCGSHPLAGSDKSGVQHASGDLFQDRTVVVTPGEQTPESAISRVESLWKDLGGVPGRMSPADHDKALAVTSHLPHVLAAVLAGATPEELKPLVGSGWRDTTRIAAGNVDLWLQIIAENRTPILYALERFDGALQTWRKAIENEDLEQVAELLAKGKFIRDSLGS